MRPNHPSRVLWWVAVLAVVLAACGGGGDSEIVDDFSDAPPDSGAEAETEAGASGGDGERFDAAGIDPPERADAPVEEPPSDLVDAACEEGALVVYESTPGDAMTNVLDAFREAYPCIEQAEHVRLPAAEIPLRVLQESNAGTPTADVGMTSADFAASLHEQGLVDSVDWESYGVPAELAAPYSVVTAASLYTIFYNTDLVPADQAPEGWEDLEDPSWEGSLAVWSRPAPQSLLVVAWGPEKVQEHVQALIDNGATLYEDNPTIPQAVGAGEHPVGVVNYHAGVPILESDAPVEVVFPDPLPTTLIHSWIPSESGHPNAARLFATWLNTEEGSATLEGETNRGNALIPGTQAFELTQDVEISSFPADQIDVYEHWLEELSGTWR